MKNVFIFVWICLTAICLTCCGNKKNNVQNRQVDIVDNKSISDSTIYGRCGDGTSMNVLQLVTDKGETMELLLEGTDTCANVQGGLLAGDRLAVIAYKNENGELCARTVVNLTSLLGKWSSIDRNFTIEEGGVVNGDNTEPNPYIEWKINNGRLVLGADTFSVYSLGPDSLLLENANGIYSYKRILK